MIYTVQKRKTFIRWVKSKPRGSMFILRSSPEKNNTLGQWLQFHHDIGVCRKRGGYVLRKHLSYGLLRFRFWNALRSSDNHSNRYGWVNLFERPSIIVEPECIRSIHAHFLPFIFYYSRECSHARKLLPVFLASRESCLSWLLILIRICSKPNLANKILVSSSKYSTISKFSWRIIPIE